MEMVISFLTLFCLELVLGIDNIVFISILSSKLPLELQQKARMVGLSLAVGTRILLLLSISWIVSLTQPLFSAFEMNFSGRDLILILGGLFLLFKSTAEIHHKIEGVAGDENPEISKVSFNGIIFQILLLDIVFSLDSVITAVGMANQVSIMISAVILSTVVMIFSSKSISDFIDKHPSLKILALSFLLLIGFTLLVEGFGQHVSKGYVYFAMAFSLVVEFLNIRMRSQKTQKLDPLQLRERVK